MANVRLWGKIERVGPRDFFVIASAVTDPPTDCAIVLTAEATSLVDANQGRARLLVELGEKARERGDRVVDVEEE